MTVFKTFFKIMSKNIATVILYTVLLILFGGMQYKNDNQVGFSYEKPNVIIVDNDNSRLSNNLVNYFKENANVKIDYKEIDDAIFYRQANYVIYIYDGYADDVLSGNFKELDIKESGDYMSSLASMMLNRYLNVQDKYSKLNNEDEINNKVNIVLNEKTNINIKSKLNTTELTKLASYYNFANYTILAAIVLVVSLIISSFNNINIKKRTIVSSINYKKYNTQLLKSAGIYAIVIWIFYNLLALLLNGSLLVSVRGLLYMINSLLLTFVCLCLSILISNLVTNKNAINGIVNVLAIGSSFICGVFVPAKWLGDNILKIAHIFPTYYYVNSNNLFASIEEINFKTLRPFINNSIIIIIFIIIFVVINNIVTNYKRKVG